MFGKIKDAIQGRLYKNCIEEYHRELRYQTDPYLLWIKENEQSSVLDTKEESDPSLEVVYMETCGRNFSLAAMDHEKEYVVFVSSEGRVAESAFHEMIQYFETHKDVNIVYADEDVWMLGQGTASEKGDKAQKKGSESEENDESAHRIFPWTKPMWSPDTLFSFSISAISLRCANRRTRNWNGLETRITAKISTTLRSRRRNEGNVPDISKKYCFMHTKRVTAGAPLRNR